MVTPLELCLAEEYAKACRTVHIVLENEEGHCPAIVNRALTQVDRALTQFAIALTDTKNLYYTGIRFQVDPCEHPDLALLNFIECGGSDMFDLENPGMFDAPEDKIEIH